MVTRSPLSASLASGASGRGSCRNGACGSTTSNKRPPTKSAAGTFPSRCFAARSARAGVTRGSKARIFFFSGSAVAGGKQRVERPRNLALAAFGPAGLGIRSPGEQIEVYPGFRGHEAPHEQRRRDGAALAAADIVDIGDFGFEHRFVR